MVDYPDSAAIPDYTRLMKLEGKGFVVLGAGDGMGRQTCHALAQAGARVLCVDRDLRLAQTIAAEVSGLAAAADVTVRADMERVFRLAGEHFGQHLRGLVDIVGAAQIGSLAELDDGTWDRQFDIVLRHAWMTIQLGGAALADGGGGSMVFVGSISGLVSVPHQAAYGAAKAALHHLVRCSAHELGPRGVRVNAVAPGFVRTPRLLSRLNDSFWERAAEMNPMRRVAIPADIASAILFLCSDLAAYVTANVMTLDGGTSSLGALPEIHPNR